MIENITGLTGNLTMGSTAIGAFNNTCVLNQYAVIEATKKLPIVALWLSLAIFVVLGFYWIGLPFFTKSKYYDLMRESIPGFAFAISIWLPLILMYSTLQFTEVQFHNVEKYLMWGAGLLVIISLFFRRKEIMNFFKKLREGGTDE